MDQFIVDGSSLVDGSSHLTNCFSQNHGDNVILLEDNMVAYRKASFANAVTISERPVLPGEIFLVEIEQTEPGWTGHMRLGLTQLQPINPLPLYSMPDLSNRGDSWICAITKRHNRLRYRSAAALRASVRRRATAAAEARAAEDHDDSADTASAGRTSPTNCEGNHSYDDALKNNGSITLVSELERCNIGDCSTSPDPQSNSTFSHSEQSECDSEGHQSNKVHQSCSESDHGNNEVDQSCSEGHQGNNEVDQSCSEGHQGNNEVHQIEDPSINTEGHKSSSEGHQMNHDGLQSTNEGDQINNEFDQNNACAIQITSDGHQNTSAMQITSDGYQRYTVDHEITSDGQQCYSDGLQNGHLDESGIVVHNHLQQSARQPPRSTGDSDCDEDGYVSILKRLSCGHQIRTAGGLVPRSCLQPTTAEDALMPLPTDEGSRVGLLYLPQKDSRFAEMHYIINGEDQGIFTRLLPYKDVPLHAIVDVYGATKKVRIIQLYGVVSLKSACRRAILYLISPETVPLLPLPPQLLQYLQSSSEY